MVTKKSTGTKSLFGNEALKVQGPGHYLKKKKGTDTRVIICQRRKALEPGWLFVKEERHRDQGDYLSEKKGTGTRVVICQRTKAQGPG